MSKNEKCAEKRRNLEHRIKVIKRYGHISGNSPSDLKQEKEEYLRNCKDFEKETDKYLKETNRLNILFPNGI